MPRPNRPWFRNQTDWWMAKIGGKSHKLAKGRKNKAAAETKFHELMLIAFQAPESPDARVADVCEEFLRWSRKHHAADTYRSYNGYLQSFCERYGQLPVGQLQKFHVTRWVDAQNWNETSQYNGRRFVFRAFNWATDEGLLQRNPLQGMPRPKPKPRKRALKPEEFRALLAGARGPFKVFLFALRQTGARPKELRDLQWDHVRSDRWVLAEHKTDKSSDAPRTIHLTPAIQNLMAVLRRRSQSQHVFVNHRGAPWTANAVRLQIWRIKRRLQLPDDVCAYLVRHTFGTAAILNGVDIAPVATLMGHADTTITSKVQSGAILNDLRLGCCPAARGPAGPADDLSSTGRAAADRAGRKARRGRHSPYGPYAGQRGYSWHAAPGGEWSAGPDRYAATGWARTGCSAGWRGERLEA
jgi:integrase